MRTEKRTFYIRFGGGGEVISQKASQSRCYSSPEFGDE